MWGGVICLHQCWNLCATVYVGRSEENFWEFVLSFQVVEAQVFFFFLSCSCSRLVVPGNSEQFSCFHLPPYCWTATFFTWVLRIKLRLNNLGSEHFRWLSQLCSILLNSCNSSQYTLILIIRKCTYHCFAQNPPMLCQRNAHSLQQVSQSSSVTEILND